MKRRRKQLSHIAAYHEAGHVVVANTLGAGGRRVSIDEDSGRSKVTRLGRGERAVLIILAGPYAQRRRAPHSRWRSRNHTGFKSDTDFDLVTDLIFDMYGKGKVANAYWRFVEARAEELVEQHWQKIDAVAKALLRHGEITGDIRRFFPPPPGVAPEGRITFGVMGVTSDSVVRKR